jgi:hypothetical protein
MEANVYSLILNVLRPSSYARLRQGTRASAIHLRFERQMNLTPYHARYFAHELTKRSSSDNVDKLADVLSDSQVDLNLHQIEAALFAFGLPCQWEPSSPTKLDLPLQKEYREVRNDGFQ